MAGNGKVTRERLVEVLDYDPDTGVFSQKIATGHRSRVGERAGHAGPGGRWVINIDKKVYYATHLAWLWVKGNWPTGKLVYDGEFGPIVKFSLVREVTQSELVISSQKGTTNKSGFRGVSWSKTKGRWIATITRDNRQYVLGAFVEKEQAAEAYNRALQGTLPEHGTARDANWKRSRRQRSAPWKAISENPRIVGWDSVDQFIADMGLPPTSSHVLMRQRYGEPFGPGNAMWDLPWSKRSDHAEDPRRSYNLKKVNSRPNEWNTLYAEQRGCCAICGQPERMKFKGEVRRLAQDHDHRTGDSRGLLCGQCNNGLGRFDDDPLRLRAAAEYLEAWAEKQTNVVPLVKKDAS